MKAIVSLRIDLSRGRCDGSVEKMTMTIKNMEPIVKHVFFTDHDLRKTNVVVLSDVIYGFIIGKDVRGRKPRSFHSPAFEPLRRGRKKWWRLEKCDVVPGNVF